MTHVYHVTLHSPIQNLIIDSGALPELKRLMAMRDHPEIQCHVAGTFRNLAAEDQSQVYGGLEVNVK